MAEQQAHTVLFVASEAFPLIKTGGLGDVAGSLPRALTGQKQRVRLLLPAYADAIANVSKLRTLAHLIEDGLDIKLYESTLPGSRVKIWLVDCPELFDRPGNPYLDTDGLPWPDNARRFSVFSRIAVKLALNQCGLNWRPDIVHCNDWQTGLVPALLAQQPRRPATVFTIHNLAYQGLFSFRIFQDLQLPSKLWSHHALEFHGQLSFIKGGLIFADRINTVSPTYAEEIQTEAFGYGLDGLLRHRQAHLNGIINGININEWNPAKDPHLPQPYNARRLADKQVNKRALQERSGLPVDTEQPLIGLVSRLVTQKGIDLILEVMTSILELPLQLVILGSGEHSLEQALLAQAKRHPRQLSVHIGYNESLAHLIEAGADMFLMPSRFEPCGLNQLYSLRYGTVPIVHRVGGLADTVIDADNEYKAYSSATGIVFAEETSADLLAAIGRALALYQEKSRWQQLQRNGMRQDFSWRRSAKQYVELYDQAVADNPYPLSVTSD